MTGEPSKNSLYSDGVPFAKGHGTGNDFILLPDFDGEWELTPGLIRTLCDRHAGLGADGVLRVVRSAAIPAGEGFDASVEWFMDYRNADGSLAEMCGNGVRVYVRYLLERGLIEAGRLPLATRGGVKWVTVDATGVTADMGPPRIGPSSSAVLAGVRYDGVAVSMGNPHLVCVITEPVRSLDLTAPLLTDSEVFPAGTNVEWANLSSGGAVMRVHERGVGETRSCGTGACAVAVAVLRAQGRDSGVVTVDVPGGRLRVDVREDTCLLSGPAVIVAEGYLSRDWLALVSD